MPGTATTPPGCCRKVRCPRCTAVFSEPASSSFKCPICSTLLSAKGTPGDPESRSSEILLNNGKAAEGIQQTKQEVSKWATDGKDERSKTREQQRPVNYEKKEGTSINCSAKSQEQQPMAHMRKEGDLLVEKYREQERQPMSSVRNESTPVIENDSTRGQQFVNYTTEDSLAINRKDGMPGLQKPVGYVNKEGISLNGDDKTQGVPPLPPMDYVNKQATLINGHDRTREKLPMDYGAKEDVSIGRKEGSLIAAEDEGLEGHDYEERDSVVDGNSWILQSQILRDTHYDLSFKYSLEAVSSLEPDDQPLHRKGSHGPNDGSDMRLYTPLKVRLSHSSGESSDQSDHERYSSGFESDSHDGSESDFDFPAPSSESLQAIKLPASFGQSEKFYSGSDCAVSATPHQLEMQDLDDVIDLGESTFQEPCGLIEGPQLEVPSQVDDAGKIAFDVERGPDLGGELETNNNKLLFQGNDVVKKEPVFPRGLDEAQASISEFSGHPQSDNFPPRLADLPNSRSFMVLDGGNPNPDMVGSDTVMFLNGSRQQVHGTDVGDVFSGGEQKVLDWNQGTVSQDKESKQGPNSDQWKEVSESLDMLPFDGEQCLNPSGLCNVKEKSMNAEDSMGSSSGGGEDANFLTFQEVIKLKQSVPNVIFSDLNNISCSDDKMQNMERKHGPSSQSEATSSCLIVQKDIHLEESLHSAPREELNTAVLQESTVTERHTLSDNSAAYMPESRMYLERNGPPERLQLRDREGKLHDRFIPQVQRSRNGKGLYMVGSDRNPKGSAAIQERFVQPPSGLVEWQGHNTFLQNQSCQADLHVVEQSPGCFSHHPVNNFFGLSLPNSQQCAYTNHHSVSDPFGLGVPIANRAHPYQAPSHPSMLPVAMQDHTFTHCGYHPISPICMLCVHQHSHTPQLQMLHCGLCFSQPASIAHQPGHGDCWNCHQTHHAQASVYASSLVGCSQTCVSSKLAQTHDTPNVELISQALSERKHKHYPPLPQGCAAPYIMCKGCSRILQVPACLPPNDGMTQRLRCSGCGKVSKFSIHHDTQQISIVPSSQSVAVASVVGAESMLPLVQSSEYSRQLPVPNVTQSMESSYHQGLVSVSPRFHPSYAEGPNKILPQTNGIKATISTARTLDHYSQGEGLSRSQSRYCETDTFVNTCGVSNFSFSASTTCPSSPLESALSHCAVEIRKDEALRVGESGFEGSKMSNGVPLNSSEDEKEEGLDFGAPRISDGDSLDHSESRFRSPENKQGYPQDNYGEVLGNKPLNGHQSSWTTESCQQQVYESNWSTERGTSLQKNPGSPLLVLLNQESRKFNISLQERVPFEDSGSALPTPESGSPLHGHPTHERPYEKEQYISRSHGASTQHFVSRGPRYIAGLLRRSLRDFGRGQ